MATAAQVLASQANAQHSTGPVSPQGKAISARNRLNHGFRSATVLLPGDDPAEYEFLLNELSEHFSPTDLTELRLTREMADAEWRLRRVRGYMESAISRHMATLAGQNPAMNPLDLQSLAVETLHQTGCSHATWLRYETKFERQYDRAYATWTRYQDNRTRIARREIDLAVKRSLRVPPPAAEPESPTLGSNVQTTPSQQDPAETAASPIARNALCPCGSMEKFKRCCGRSAPPVLHPATSSTAAQGI